MPEGDYMTLAKAVASSYEECIWLYCDKCGRKFSARRNHQQKFCPECHDEFILSRVKFKKRDNSYNYTWRLLHDPEGSYPVGALFGAHEIYYGLRYGSFANGTVLMHIKDKCQFTVRGPTLVNKVKSALVGRNGRLEYVPRKAER